jgi:hypothetical protein
MKRTLTLALSICLFASVTILADGNQGTGSRNNDCLDPNNCPPAECTQGCPDPGAFQAEEDEGDLAEYVEEFMIETILETIEFTLY